MIHVIQQESKRSIWHALEIDEVYLTSRPKAVCHNGMQSSNWATACLTLDANGTQVSVQLTIIPCNIVNAITDATV